jgi:hypothetical protein
LQKIDSTLTIYRLLRGSVQNDDQVWFNDLDSVFVRVDFLSGRKFEFQLPLHIIESVYTVNDSSQLIQGFDTILNSNVSALIINNQVFESNLKTQIYEHKIVLDNYGKRYFVIDDKLYFFNGREFELFYEGCDIGPNQFIFSTKNELIVKETCKRGRRRLFNISTNTILINDIESESGDIGFFIDKQENIYCFGDNGVFYYSKSNYKFKEWSDYVNSQNITLGLSWPPNQKVKNNGDVELFFGDNFTINGLKGDTFILNSFELSGLFRKGYSAELKGYFNNFFHLKNKFYFNIYNWRKINGGEMKSFKDVFSIDSSLEVNWVSKSYLGKRIEDVTFKNEKIYFLTEDELWEKNGDDFTNHFSELRTGTYKLLNNDLWKQKSNPYQTLDFEVYQATNSAQYDLVFNYNSNSFLGLPI